jgi:hypothetical protein
MKSLVLSALVVLLTIRPAAARMGETLDECVQRYGPMIERRPAKLGASDPDVMVFSKAGITVAVEFKEGKAWHLTFRKTALTSFEIEALITANSGTSLWGSPLKTRDKEYRMTADKGRVALINWDRKALAGSLVIMSREFARTNHQELAHRPDPTTVVPTGVSNKGTVLPGF